MSAAAPRLLLVTPPQADVTWVAQLLPRLRGVADAVVLRWPSWSDRERFAAFSRMAAVSPRPPLLAADRFDLAVAAGLEGVQLRDAGLPPARVRALYPRLLIGVSRHAATAGLPCDGADWMLLAPVFSTPSKPSTTPLGTAGLAEVCRSARVPVVGLGGITTENAALLRRAGAWGGAAVSSVFDARDPAEAAAGLRAVLAACP